MSLNLGESSSTDDYSLSSGVATGKVVTHIPPHPKVAIGRGLDDVMDDQVNRELAEDKVLDLSKVTLRPGEGVVVSLLLGNEDRRSEFAASEDDPINVDVKSDDGNNNKNNNINVGDDEIEVLF